MLWLYNHSNHFFITAISILEVPSNHVYGPKIACTDIYDQNDLIMVTIQLCQFVKSDSLLCFNQWLLIFWRKGFDPNHISSTISEECPKHPADWFQFQKFINSKNSFSKCKLFLFKSFLKFCGGGNPNMDRAMMISQTCKCVI